MKFSEQHLTNFTNYVQVVSFSQKVGCKDILDVYNGWKISGVLMFFRIHVVDTVMSLISLVLSFCYNL